MLTLQVVKERSIHANEVRPRRNKRGVDLISDALPFGRLWSCEAADGQLGSVSSGFVVVAEVFDISELLFG
jgi:hypothetical protein